MLKFALVMMSELFILLGNFLQGKVCFSLVFVFSFDQLRQVWLITHLD